MNYVSNIARLSRNALVGMYVRNTHANEWRLGSLTACFTERMHIIPAQIPCRLRVKSHCYLMVYL